MKKFFLFSLLTLMCSVMAAGKNYQVGSYADLKAALEAGDATLIELTDNITYEGAWDSFDSDGLYDANAKLTGLEDALCITNSLTLDGNGHEIIGFGKFNVSVTAANNNHRVSLAVKPTSTDAGLQVTIQNLKLGNHSKNKRYYGILAFDGVDSLLIQNDSILCGNYSYNQPLCVTGAIENPKLHLGIKDSYLNAGTSSYPVYVLKPINGWIEKSVFEGYCSLYFKYRATGVYGDVAGTRGSVVYAQNCAFNAPNIHSGESNDFAVFPIEDDGIDLTIDNCSFNADHFGDQPQAVISLQYNKRTSGFQPVNVKFKGDNTHVYNVATKNFAWNSLATGNNAQVTQEGGRKGVNVVLNIEISGGIYDIDPTLIQYSKYGETDWPYDGKYWAGHASNPVVPAYSGEWASATIAAGYEISEVKQGDKTLYRVVKKAAEKEPGVMYDLNDKVAGEGIANGDNPVSSFDLSTGTDMTLNQETTTAGYVQISDNATAGATTVTVAKNDADIEHSQTLVINNGLDVQGSSSVTVEPTAALVIGEGGITTQSPENIVIEADEDGAASLLLHPEITVNQTPELTVKMTAKQIGKVGADYFWHRFAMPVDAISSLPKEPSVTTKIFGWDYENEDWKSLSTLADLKPFYGYTLTTTADRQDVTYTFQGHLVGNLNETLNFTDEGYNFFGNSYTGYIDIVSLADQLLDHADIDGAVWVWNTDKQSYHVVTLAALRDYPSLYKKWQKEIAPMQTFILRLATPGVKSASTVVDYKSAIWDNPRYGNGGGAGAPARKNAFEGNAIRMTVAANGMKDEVLFIEKANFSDEFDKGYDGTKFMNTEAINIYSTVNNENYSAIATDQIEGKMLTIETVNEVNYTISFDVVMGETEFALRDNATNKVIAIEAGASYEFAAQPNSTVEGRFEIVDRANVVTSIDNAQDNKANVKGIYTIMGQYVGENFDVLPTGVYVVDGVKIVK